MASFEVKTRRAVTLSILVRWPHLFHEDAANVVVHHRANRDIDTMTGSYEKTVKKTAVLARRLVSWFFFRVYNTQNSTFRSVRRVKMYRFPRGERSILFHTEAEGASQTHTQTKAHWYLSYLFSLVHFISFRGGSPPDPPWKVLGVDVTCYY